MKKPDIVIVDSRSKSVHIFELTVPGEARLDTAHRLKANSYAHLLTDMQSHTVTVTPFEVGAHTMCRKSSKLVNMAEAKYIARLVHLVDHDHTEVVNYS